MWRTLKQWLSRPRSAERLAAPRLKPTRLGFDVLEDRAVPATLVVNTLADNHHRDNVLTLREATLLVNHRGDASAALGRHLTKGERALVSGRFGRGDRIQFAATLANQTLVLNGSQLDITRSVVLDSSGLDKFTIDANNASRIFNINDGRSTSITVRLLGSQNNGLILKRGNAAGNGGAILNAENLSIDHCVVRDSQASLGGGVYNTGSLTVASLTFLENNRAREGGAGGGIYNRKTLLVENSFFNLNQATYGGAIVNDAAASATIHGSSFDANSASGVAGGGAIYNAGRLSLDNTVFTFNAADNGLGGAIHNIDEGVATLTGSFGSTGGGGFNFKRNHAQSGGAFFNDYRSTTSVSGVGYFNFNQALGGHGGGAIYNRGTFVSNASVIYENNQATYGGAFYNAGGTASLIGSVFSGNFADGYDGGGAIHNAGTMTVAHVVIDSNTSVGNGGGIANTGNLDVANCRITNNRADSDGDGVGLGGGIYSSPNLLITDSDISGNFVGAGSTESNVVIV